MLGLLFFFLGGIRRNKYERQDKEMARVHMPKRK